MLSCCNVPGVMPELYPVQVIVTAEVMSDTVHVAVATSPGAMPTLGLDTVKTSTA